MHTRDNPLRPYAICTCRSCVCQSCCVESRYNGPLLHNPPRKKEDGQEGRKDKEHASNGKDPASRPHAPTTYFVPWLCWKHRCHQRQRTSIRLVCTTRCSTAQLRDRKDCHVRDKSCLRHHIEIVSYHRPLCVTRRAQSSKLAARAHNDWGGRRNVEYRVGLVACSTVTTFIRTRLHNTYIEHSQEEHHLQVPENVPPLSRKSPPSGFMKRKETKQGSKLLYMLTGQGPVCGRKDRESRYVRRRSPVARCKDTFLANL